MQETAFVSRCAPLPSFRKVLDACCGMGRHARILSSRGYSVIGIDRDSDAIARARALAGRPSYENVDIRDYRSEPRRVRHCHHHVSELWLFRFNNKLRNP